MSGPYEFPQISTDVYEIRFFSTKAVLVNLVLFDTDSNNLPDSNSLSNFPSPSGSLPWLC